MNRIIKNEVTDFTLFWISITRYLLFPGGDVIFDSFRHADLCYRGRGGHKGCGGV